MTDVQTDRLPQSELIPVKSQGWLGGFANLLRKEMDQWWGTKAWWIQLLVWLVTLVGIGTVILLEGISSGLPEGEIIHEVIQTFLLMAGMAVGLGVVVTIQGAIVGEKESGTAAWIMSKPVSRQSFVLAKMAAHTVGFWVTALVVPGAMLFVEIELLTTVGAPIWPFVRGLSLVGLVVLFYVAFTLTLGTFFAGRGPIAGAVIGFGLAGMFFKDMLPEPLVMLTPWPVPDMASLIALGSTLPAGWMRPVVATVGWLIVLTALALWRFGREEL